MLATTPNPRSNKRNPPNAVNQTYSRHIETRGGRKMVSPRKTNQRENFKIIFYFKIIIK